jgi:uncharacterized protein YhbP (UPF0306 family)
VSRETKHRASAEKIRKVFEFLQSESTLVLSTRDKSGAVHATPLFYLVTDNLDLLWLSSPSSAHSKAVLLEPHASLAVFHSTFEWRKIVGVQMHGTCSTIKGSERTPILDAYRQRFQLGTALSLAISRTVVYRFRPHWVRYIDNQKRFGYKFEFVL